MYIIVRLFLHFWDGKNGQLRSLYLAPSSILVSFFLNFISLCNVLI